MAYSIQFRSNLGCIGPARMSKSRATSRWRMRVGGYQFLTRVKTQSHELAATTYVVQSVAQMCGSTAKEQTGAIKI